MRLQICGRGMHLVNERGGEHMLLRALYYFPKVYKAQYLSPENLRRMQEKRLRYLVNFVYRNTAIYKEKFKKAGIIPSDIQTRDDITKIPLTTKDEIKEVYPHGIITAGFTGENCTIETTSGSSGNMLKILHDPQAKDRCDAVIYRDMLGAGVRPWHRYCVMTHVDLTYEQLLNQSPLSRVLTLPEMMPEEEKVEVLRRWRPHVVGGHPSLLVMMAKVIEKEGIEDMKPELILVGGELAYPEYRKYIEKVFGCETFDKYGAYETYSLSWECDHHRNHIDADSAFVEFLKDGEPVAPGERGEVVVTNLWNRAMPFIRYRLGDIGSPSDELCECGRTLPLIKDVEGKADDFIVLPSGELISSRRVIPPFFAEPSIGQFKVIQDKKSHVIVKIAPLSGFTEEIEQKILKEVQGIVGELMSVEIEKVDVIEQTGRGKFKRVHRLYCPDLNL